MSQSRNRSSAEEDFSFENYQKYTHIFETIFRISLKFSENILKTRKVFKK